MAINNDFFGYTYKDNHPAFVLVRQPSTTEPPVDESRITTQGYYYVHRPTMRLLSAEEVNMQMEKAGYTPQQGEIGEDWDWLESHYGPGGVAGYVPPVDPTEPVDPFVCTVEDAGNGYSLMVSFDGGKRPFKFAPKGDTWILTYYDKGPHKIDIGAGDYTALAWDSSDDAEQQEIPYTVENQHGPDE